MSIRHHILTSVCLCLFGTKALAFDVQNVDPPFWWASMTNPELQIMVHGEDISSYDVTLRYPGVKISNLTRTDNPNYLFICLNISPKAKPGTLDLNFKSKDGGIEHLSYELKQRSTEPGAMGFTTEDVLYLITPDRFANGDSANDTIGGARVDRKRSGGRHGGDIRGVRDHLDYIEDLGVTTIWLNPVQENSAGSYHGYAITDFYAVDPRFGTMDEYVDFIREAHSRGLKVVMDMIFNHCGSTHWWMNDLPCKDWLNFEGNFRGTNHQKWTTVDPHAAPSERQLFTDGWFNRGMPDLNQRNPLVATYLIQNGIWWIEHARIDGIRQDTYPYMDKEFGERWCRETFAEYPDFNITGETWFPVGSGFPAWWQRGSMFGQSDSGLKTVMDFNLAFIVGRAFDEPNSSSDGASGGLFDIYVSMANDFQYSDTDNILVFLDNHDISRFTKEEDKGLSKYKQGIAFILTTRGIPQIYYGTELLFTGTKKQGDGVIRKDMPGGWDSDTRSVFTKEGRTDEENAAFDYMSSLLAWRKSSGAVKHGKLIQYAPLPEYGDCYVYARILGDETVLVILNGSDRAAVLDMTRYSDVIGKYTCGTEVVTGDKYEITGKLAVPSRGTLVLTLSDDVVLHDGTIADAPFSVFSEGLIDKVSPEGWLREILQRQRDGLTSHPEAMAYPFNTCLWAGELARDSDKRGADWWRFEQTAYYLDGLGRLGFVLDDEKLLATLKENIDYVLDHSLPFKEGKKAAPENRRQEREFNAQVSADPRSQQRAEASRLRREKQARIDAADRPEGRLGPETGSMAWPFAVFFRAMKACYEATGDSRIPGALEKNYLSYTVEELGMSRFVVNVEGMLWTYSITGNPELLERAIAAWNQNASELTQANCLDETEYHMHGVTMNELLKVPLLLYAYTGDRQYLDAALKAESKMEGPNMLIDGVNSSTEALAGNDALASHETCDISDFTWTMGYYLMVTGESGWADRIEKAIFNAGLGAITKDFKSMQYFSCPNQFTATGNSNHNGFKHGLTWMAYRPVHETECCIGNLHRYMPNYAARMWLKDRNGNPVAALYGPSSIEYDLGGGTTVRIEERTAYPFEEKIEFAFTFYKDGRVSEESHKMDFTYRIPAWCDAAEAGFRTVEGNWKSGDTFTVELPMHIEIVDNPVDGKCIQRGPVVYSYAIPADWEEDTAIYDNMAGKVSANPDFKSWSIRPAGKWNYALVGDRLDDLTVEFTGSTGFPFDPESVPVKIRIPAVGVKGWKLVEDRYTPALPEQVIKESEKTTYIELVPYGSTTLRLTTFPVTEK